MQKFSTNLLQNFQKIDRFISFEGLEAAGKTLQITKLKNYLKKKNIPVKCVRDPGGTIFGEELRSIILNCTEKISSLAEAHLFAASRTALITQIIQKDLKQVVISDRYIDSALAYQGFAGELSADSILKMHINPPLNKIPTLTFYLRIDLRTSMERQERERRDKDYFEKKSDTFYQKLIEGYDSCAYNFPERIKVIDGLLDPQTIHRQIKDSLDNFL